MTFRKVTSIHRPGLEVVTGRDSDTGEYRCRLKVEGVPKPAADYFTNDKTDAFDTANSMINTAYAKNTKLRADSIPAWDLSQLVGIANDVWQYIGSDFLEGGEDFDNEAAVECCFDADRPLLCTNGPKDTAAARNAYCKAQFAEHGFDAVVLAVSRVVRFV